MMRCLDHSETIRALEQWTFVICASFVPPESPASLPSSAILLNREAMRRMHHNDWHMQSMIIFSAIARSTTLPDSRYHCLTAPISFKIDWWITHAGILPQKPTSMKKRLQLSLLELQWKIKHFVTRRLLDGKSFSPLSPAEPADSNPLSFTTYLQKHYDVLPTPSTLSVTRGHKHLD